MSDQHTPKDEQDQTCNCVTDPFASLPPELHPKKKGWKTGLRQVTCPSCGLEYWTNSKGDLCSACQQKHPANTSRKSDK